jgi:lysyl-tRNA synthetase class 2
MAEATDRLKLRASTLAQVRHYFADRNILEVDTPILSSAGTTDPNLHSLTTQLACQPAATQYLQTSPELAMKRLLAAGCGDIYQIARVFRDAELGPYHQPEFTLIEWYRVGWNEHQLSHEVIELIGLLGNNPELGYQEISYQEAFTTYCQLDPLTADTDQLIACAKRHGLNLPTSPLEKTELLDLIMSALVAPQLGKTSPTILFDFPASQAALAQLQPADTRVAARFEVFWRGIELANGFRELTDPIEQRRRFETENADRRARQLMELPIDEAFLATLHALPPCSGVALGFDRLLMLLAGSRRIDAVMTLPVQSAPAQ